MELHANAARNFVERDFDDFDEHDYDRMDESE
jgi:hypothetical protein